MLASLKNLDGNYEIQSETSYGGPFGLEWDNFTTIKNGLTYRKDKKGYIWESSFNIVDKDQVEIKSTVDCSHAGENAYITDEKGNPTKSIVTYKSIMDVKIIDNKIIMSGTIKHGIETTHLTLKQI